MDSRRRIDTPMVMTTSRKSPGFFNHRIKMNSTAAPAKAVTMTATMTANRMGMWEESVMEIIPPSTRNSPCAKLIIPVAL